MADWDSMDYELRCGSEHDIEDSKSLSSNIII